MLTIALKSKSSELHQIILSINHSNSFLLFKFITKSQKSNSFKALNVVEITSTSANKGSFQFQIISTSA
jgi:hypothetical protein